MYKINKIIREIDTSKVIIDKDKFKDICEKGCKVFNQKWSCPPVSPIFIPKGKAIVVILWMENTIDAKMEYTKVKAINSILKSNLNKLLYKFPNKDVLGSGSCRVCQKCAFPNACKHPDRMIYSLESVGIDVEKLCFSLGHELQWYKKGEKKAYAYGSVVGLVYSDLDAVIQTLNNISPDAFTDDVMEMFA